MAAAVRRGAQGAGRAGRYLTRQWPGRGTGGLRPDGSRHLCDRGIIIAGDPDSCIKGVRLYEAAGVDQVILITQTETIPHERALQSIEMFGKHVIPACRAGARTTPIPAGV